MKHAAEMHNGKGAYQCQYCKKVSSVSVHCTGSFIMWEQSYSCLQLHKFM
jgi:hypothetical protein